MTILGIDPGPEKSAFVVLKDETKVVQHGIVQNLNLVRQLLCFSDQHTFDHIGIEMIACYGMPVGKEVFETCVWIGRMLERAPIEPRLVYRKDVKLHFCQSPRAKDANVRQSILDRFGGKTKAIGLKASQGPLYAIKSHLWSALAISLYILDSLNAQGSAMNGSKTRSVA